MEAILEYLTLTKIIGIFLFLASLWLLRIFLKNDRRNLFRGVILFLFFLLVMLYLNQSDSKKLTLADVRDTIIPVRAMELNYWTEQGRGSASHITTYHFDDPPPRLSVTLDDSGQHLHISDPKSLNKVLRTIGLPEVTKGAQELVTITGSQLHASMYRWDDYELGILIVLRKVHQNRQTLESFPCIANIQVNKIMDIPR